MKGYVPSPHFRTTRDISSAAATTVTHKTERGRRGGVLRARPRARAGRRRCGRSASSRRRWRVPGARNPFISRLPVLGVSRVKQIKLRIHRSARKFICSFRRRRRQRRRTTTTTTKDARSVICRSLINLSSKRRRQRVSSPFALFRLSSRRAASQRIASSHFVPGDVVLLVTFPVKRGHV